MEVPQVLRAPVRKHSSHVTPSAMEVPARAAASRGGGALLAPRFTEGTLIATTRVFKKSRSATTLPRGVAARARKTRQISLTGL